MKSLPSEASASDYPIFLAITIIFDQDGFIRPVNKG